MNILVIGNGFDIAHDLPTKYIDFLDFVQDIKEFSEPMPMAGYKNKDHLWKKINESKNENLIRFEKSWNDECSPQALQDLKKVAFDNMWIDYFQIRKKENIGDNWIDIEREIKNVIKLISTENLKIIETNSITDISDISEIDLSHEKKEVELIDEKLPIIDILNKISNDKKACIADCLYEEYKQCLKKDMDRFITAFEIYLDFFVSKIKIEKGIEEMRIHSKDNSDRFQKVISFNYIDTYNKNYVISKTPVCFVHGEANYTYNKVKKETSIEEIVKSNNMVLGFEEYLPDGEKDKNLEFVYYKKYFQRIYKGTGSEYLSWLDDWKVNGINKCSAEPEKKSNKPNHLFVFGHSLDVTDKDIFKELILRDDTKVTIYYHDEYSHEQEIVNLIGIIGQDKLIKKTHGINPDIEFIPQQSIADVQS